MRMCPWVEPPEELPEGPLCASAQAKPVKWGRSDPGARRVSVEVREHCAHAVGAHEHVVVREQHGVGLESGPHRVPVEQRVAAHARNAHLRCAQLAALAPKGGAWRGAPLAPVVAAQRGRRRRAIPHEQHLAHDAHGSLRGPGRLRLPGRATISGPRYPGQEQGSDGEKLPKCFVSADWLRMSGAEQARYEAYGTGGTMCTQDGGIVARHLPQRRVVARVIGEEHHAQPGVAPAAVGGGSVASRTASHAILRVRRAVEVGQRRRGRHPPNLQAF